MPGRGFGGGFGVALGVGSGGGFGVHVTSVTRGGADVGIGDALITPRTVSRYGHGGLGTGGAGRTELNRRQSMVDFHRLKNLGTDIRDRAGEIAEQAKDRVVPLAAK